MTERNISNRSPDNEQPPYRATDLWAELLYKKHPEITHTILAYYTDKAKSKPHVEKLRRYSISELATHNHFIDGNIPTIPFSIKNPESLCALSSIVGTNQPDTISSITIASQRNPDIKLENPKSFIFLDFSCKVNPHNLINIADALKPYPYDWYLLESGNSYHAIIDKLVCIRDLPVLLGDLLQRFSALSKLPFTQKHGNIIAESLMQYGYSNTTLRHNTLPLFNKAFTEFDRINDKENLTDFTFLDWGYLQHFVHELILFAKGKSAGAGYLRVSGKNSFASPILVAHRTSTQSL